MDYSELFQFLSTTGSSFNNSAASYGQFLPAAAAATPMQQHFCSATTTSSNSFYPLELMEASHEIGDDDINAPSKSILLSHDQHHQYHHQHDNEDRAVAAMRNHKEAEKRRRERINSHLDKLRTLLPCNSKVYIYIVIYSIN